MSKGNPYYVGSMITDPVMFFGRENELRRIRDRMLKGDSTAIVGLRRIGKSSLLYHLAHETKELPDKLIPVYLDLQEAGHHEPLGLLDAAWQGVIGRVSCPTDPRRIENLGDFSRRVKQLATNGFRPILCLDEFEELTDRPSFSDDFFEGLRSLGNQRVVTYITASGDPLDVLLKRTRRTSPFYNLFVNLELGGVSEQAARSLMTVPFVANQLPPPPTTFIDLGLKIAGHYPFYLQMYAYHLYELQAKRTTIKQEELLSAFSRDAVPHFQALWLHLSTNEQQSIKRLAGFPGEVSKHVIDKLVASGLVNGTPSRPRIFSDLFREHVRNGSFENEVVARPAPSHNHVPLAEIAKASISRPWQRWLMRGLVALSALSLILWAVFGWPNQRASLLCEGGKYTIGLDYPEFLATGDSSRVNWSVENHTTTTVTGTLTIILPTSHVQLEGTGNTTLLSNLQPNEARPGQVAFHRRPPARWFWQPELPLLPTVDLQVDAKSTKCDGSINPIQSGPIHGLNSFWVWLTTSGPIGWLVLAGSEWFKTFSNKKEAD